eukprot:3158142-Amphidinium_carterae.1
MQDVGEVQVYNSDSWTIGSRMSAFVRHPFLSAPGCQALTGSGMSGSLSGMSGPLSRMFDPWSGMLGPCSGMAPSPGSGL